MRITEGDRRAIKGYHGDMKKYFNETYIIIIILLRSTLVSSTNFKCKTFLALSLRVPATMIKSNAQILSNLPSIIIDINA